MDNQTPQQDIIEIQIAERKLLISSKKNLRKIIILIGTSLFLVITASFYRNRNLFLDVFNYKVNSDFDGRVLGHFPYPEIPKEELIEIQPNILVHKEMYKSLLIMKEEAKKDGIFLVFLSGYRSIKLQKDIFYSLKSIRNQNAAQRAKVSAPPGYSEHSTGFAIDIGDANNRNTDFEVEFEKTDAFRWLKNNAAKYHFKLSFGKSHHSVDYEPWHWRYEGSVKALELFEPSNRI